MVVATKTVKGLSSAGPGAPETPSSGKAAAVVDAEGAVAAEGIVPPESAILRWSSSWLKNLTLANHQRSSLEMPP